MNLASRRQNRRAWFPRERYSDTVGRAGKVIWRHPGAKLTKVLVNVNIERSLGPVQVVTSTENSVTDLIKAAIEIYVEQQRRPLLKQTHHSRYQLHYSAYSLESLKEDEKVIDLGSRNFFLCSKPGISSCSEEAIINTYSFVLAKIMELLL